MRHLSLLALVLLGCNPTADAPVPGHIESDGPAILMVNGDMGISQAMLDTVLARVPPSQLDRMKETGQITQFYDQVGVTEILYRQALAEDVLADQTIRIGAAMSVRQYLAGIMVQQAADNSVTDEAIQGKYDERAVQYVRPQVKARHILLKEADKADEVMGMVQAGGDFSELAKEHSTDPGSGRKGGDVGWFNEGRMVKEFSDAAFAADKGAILGPIESRFGFHIISVDDKRDATPIAEVRDSIVSVLKRQGQEDFLKSIKATLSVDDLGAVAEQQEPTKPSKEGPSGNGSGSGDGSGPAGGNGEGAAAGE
jgi:peptidyl-prolyl cis-trans isomerase C